MKAIATRKRALAAYYEGQRTFSQIARRFHISTSTLARWIHRQREGPGLAPLPHGGGQAPILNELAQQLLKSLVARRPQASAEELRHALEHEGGPRVSRTTVLRSLKLMGIRRARIERGPPMLDAQAQQPPPPTRYGYAARHRLAERGRAYPSSLTDAEWALVADLFKKHGAGRHETYARRMIVDAICYVVRSGCAWRMLPHDFPPWQNVYRTYRRWLDQGVFEVMHDRLRAQWRERLGRTVSPTAAVLDSQSVKTAEKGGYTATTQRRRSRDASATS